MTTSVLLQTCRQSPYIIFLTEKPILTYYNPSQPDKEKEPILSPAEKQKSERQKLWNEQQSEATAMAQLSKQTKEKTKEIKDRMK